MLKAAKNSERPKRTFNSHPDTLYFRDKMYSAALCEVPHRPGLEDYKVAKLPVSDHRREGACTGYALATVAHYQGAIPYNEKILGSHTFAIVPYEVNGFWIRNSRSAGWGREGFARFTCDEWLEQGTDVWVARLGAPVNILKILSAANSHAAGIGNSVGYSFLGLSPHIINIGNNRSLSTGGNHETSTDDGNSLFEEYPDDNKSFEKKDSLFTSA